MQRTSEYLARIDHINLRAMKTIELAFGCPVGFSDHAQGIGASPWAVVAGACVIEKHFILDRNMENPDYIASIEPKKLAILVKTIRDVEASVGDGIKWPVPREIDNKPLMQKSLVSTRAIVAGESISEPNLACKRPGYGVKPNWVAKAVKKAPKNIGKGELITPRFHRMD